MTLRSVIDDSLGELEKLEQTFLREQEAGESSPKKRQNKKLKRIEEIGILYSTTGWKPKGLK